MKKIWLDDLRNPIDYNSLTTMPDRALNILNKWGRDWVWVKDAHSAKQELSKGGFDVASFDNDLGGQIDGDGYNVLNWLEEKAATDPTFPIPQYLYAHTSNNPRAVSMEATIKSIKKFVAIRKP